MFNAKLYDFQTAHEENLLHKCADHEEMILCAPTGSGKTVLVCKFIDDYLDENPNTVFLWLCPGAGGLHKQSEDSFAETTSGIPYGDVYGFITEPDPRGHVFFINWDKINKKSNVVLREGERKDLMTKVLSCHNSNIDIFMLIDEEHKYRDTANEYIANIQPKHVLRISATPISQGDHVETIKDDEVISAGLIATGIAINEGVSRAIQENNNLDDDIRLLDLADKKRKEIQAEYDRLGLRIRPLVLIQFPNGSEEWIKRVKEALADMGYTENSGLVASWFSGDHPDHPEEIKKLDGQYAFLLFKQAIATGWDCPRAKILVKLREGGTERFNIQTVGRIRRMPLREHYDNDLIDNCYLYTLDSQFTEGLTSALNDSFYTYQYRRKQTAPNIVLTKETLDGSDRFAVNPEAVVKVVRATMLKECDLDHDGRLNKHEMEISKGYVFGTKLKTTAIEGVARTTHDMLSLNTIFGGEHQINNHDDGFIIRDAKRKIARAIGVDENISNNALRILFGPEDMQMSLLSEEEITFEREHKLLSDMTLREYNAFLVNNRDKLVDLFSEISENEIGEIKETGVLVSDWSIPPYQYYKQHKKMAATAIMGKNVFDNYGNNILIAPNRTVTEVEFERWCEGYDAVKHIYKNGDKGDEYFSIIYRKAFRRSNFYPDYIIQLENGDVWVIEAKGGMTADGSSNNIDGYAEKKFNALKAYAERVGGFKWGFVRAVGTQLYLSNTIWTEDMTNRNVWKPIEVFI
ncbi:DEAD/DEAH box helicase [Ruthenibacterium lactatiformans]|uniref:DEAD/DEAH box helicase n=1 Tax=Ruthenibacterium lactatiformans TaxID=1550024 RepID=UPI0019673BF4|nr:DEAD/DEAH box helicase family protein [Ruthenibacterium lactatiformans]MBN3032330.1 DEAD/DEAH box helicase family protein [Ruthenibacterium lactatiformans]